MVQIWKTDGDMLITHSLSCLSISPLTSHHLPPSISSSACTFNSRSFAWHSLWLHSQESPAWAFSSVAGPDIIGHETVQRCLPQGLLWLRSLGSHPWSSQLWATSPLNFLFHLCSTFSFSGFQSLIPNKTQTISVNFCFQAFCFCGMSLVCPTILNPSSPANTYSLGHFPRSSHLMDACYLY